MPRRTFIFCDQGHVIGEIVRRELRGEIVPALLVYEKSLQQVPFELPPKRCVAFGDVAGIECTICRSDVVWQPSGTVVVATVISLLNSLYEPAARRGAMPKAKS